MDAVVDQSGKDYRHPVDWSLQFDPLSLPAMFERTAARTPRAPLIDFFGRKFDYAAILTTSHRIATGLAALGIGRGDRVALLLPNVPHYVAAYYGVLRLGAVVVNLSALAPVELLREQIDATGTRLLITLTAPPLYDVAIDLLGSSRLERVVAGTVAGVLPKGKALLHRLLQRNGSRPSRSDPRVSSFDSLVANDGGVAAAAIDPDTDLALLQYSRGTTGAPKAVIFTHQALSVNARQIVSVDPANGLSGQGTPQRILGVLPLFHIFANACVMNRTIAEGGEMVLLPRFDAGETIAAIARTRATAMCGVPFMYQALLDHPRTASGDLASLTSVVTGATAMSAALKERFEAATGATLLEGYGLTEGGMIAANPMRGPQKPGTVGQQLPGTRIALADRDDAARDAAPGEAGEIVIRGPQIMSGFWNDGDGDDKDVFVERADGRWLRTGDVGAIDADGYVRIVDRLSEMIQVGDRKVFPSQLEAILLRHPVVREALVIGVGDGAAGQMPKAFVTLADGASATDETLRDWLNSRVGRHEQIVAVEIRDRLPRTLVGKPSRQELIAEERRRSARPTPPAA